MLTPRERRLAQSDDPKTWPRKVLVYSVLVNDHWLDTTTVHKRLQQLCDHLGRSTPPKRTVLKTLKLMAKLGWVDTQGRVDPQTAVLIDRQHFHWRPREFDWDGNYIWPFWKSGEKGVTLSEKVSNNRKDNPDDPE